MVDRYFTNHPNGGAIAPSLLTPTPEVKWATPVSNRRSSSGTKNLFNDNMSNVDKIILCLAEFGGTAILVFLGCMGCVQSGGPISAEKISFTFGFALMIAVQTFGHISGAHINPIITVSAAICGMISFIQVPIYLLGQYLGGIAGYGLIKAVLPAHYTTSNSSVSLCSPKPNENLLSIQVASIEFLLSLILVWTICSIWDGRNTKKLDSVSIKLGLTVAGLAMAGGGFTEAHMNPARTFGPALINGDWQNHWMYWVGPLAAGVVGGFSYKMIFLKTEPSENIRNEVESANNKI